MNESKYRAASRSYIKSIFDETLKTCQVFWIHFSKGICMSLKKPNWLILKACQTIQGYFKSWDYEIIHCKLIFTFCVVKSFLYTVIWFQVFLSNTNNLHTVIWFQVFLSCKWSRQSEDSLFNSYYTEV